MEVTTRIVQDGPRNVIVQLTGRHDGTGPAEINVRKVDVSELNPPCRSVRVQRVQYSVTYGLVKLLWDGQSPKEFMVLERTGEFDYCRSGGLSNDLVSAGDDSATGDILLSTEAFDAGSAYTVTLEMVKKS